MKYKKILLLFLSLWGFGCLTANSPSAVDVPPNYSKEASWAFLPQAQKPTKPVDVFYVYPTIFGGNGAEIMDITNADLRSKANVQIRINAGVFTDEANLYAPYYRQASIELLWLSPSEGDKLLSTGYQDIISAFEYYMQHFNKGRPFILAGFSQGSMALLNLMEQKFDNPAWRKQLVAAYLIGYSVTDEDLQKYPWLKMAQGETDTGVIVSYNTQLPGYGYSYVLKKGAKGINPISWKTDSSVAPAKGHKGAVIFDIVTGEKKEEVPNLSNVWLEKETGALAVEVDAEKYNASQSVFAPGILHMYDYMFFYNNLKDNVKKRVQHFK